MGSLRGLDVVSSGRIGQHLDHILVLLGAVASPETEEATLQVTPGNDLVHHYHYTREPF
jgi:hypothetical protein